MEQQTAREGVKNIEIIDNYVPVVSLSILSPIFGAFTLIHFIFSPSGYRVQRWFFPYDYQIIQEMHRHDNDDTSRAQLLEIGNQLTPAEARSHAISQLPREISKHTGFAFDSPGYESFFAAQLGVYAPQKAWDVARRASMKSRPKIGQKK